MRRRVSGMAGDGDSGSPGVSSEVDCVAAGAMEVSDGSLLEGCGAANVPPHARAIMRIVSAAVRRKMLRGGKCLLVTRQVLGRNEARWELGAASLQAGRPCRSLHEGWGHIPKVKGIWKFQE